MADPPVHLWQVRGLSPFHACLLLQMRLETIQDAEPTLGGHRMRSPQEGSPEDLHLPEPQLFYCRRATRVVPTPLSSQGSCPHPVRPDAHAPSSVLGMCQHSVFAALLMSYSHSDRFCSA